LNKTEGKGAAFFSRTRDTDQTTHSVCIGLGQTKAQADPALGTASVASIKPLKDMGQIVIGNSNSRIIKNNIDFSIFSLG